uniref:B30.2/SPRY domain-containing protein n=1 Tax=Maylandia zebra TaxID=106582 RepID=A0A3P9DA25_9CICH
MCCLLFTLVHSSTKWVILCLHVFYSEQVTVAYFSFAHFCRITNTSTQWKCETYVFSVSVTPKTPITSTVTLLHISDGCTGREVMRLNAHQPYPDHPERFDRPQLLCTDGLTGPCYWEVEWSGYVSIAVSYKGIKRRGHSDDCLFGLNSQSWSLDCSYSYSVLHNNTETFIPKDVVSNRVAVYVDHPAGTLSFYNIFLDSLIHLHTFNTTFTEPLYPGFGVWSHNSSVRIMKPGLPALVVPN